MSTMAAVVTLTIILYILSSCHTGSIPSVCGGIASRTNKYTNQGEYEYTPILHLHPEPTPPTAKMQISALIVDPIKTKQKHASQHPPSPVVVTVTAQKETVRNSVMAIFQRNRETDIADNISASSQEEEPRERHRRRRDPSSRLADA